MFKASGQGLSRGEKAAIEDATRQALTPTGQRGAGRRVGRNIAGKAAYVEPAWGGEGSRQATTDLVRDWSRLSAPEKKALDGAAKEHAAQLLRRVKRDKGTSPAHQNYLRIVAPDGVSGLRKALKDPNQALPVLPALGALFAPRQNESPDERS